VFVVHMDAVWVGCMGTIDQHFMPLGPWPSCNMVAHCLGPSWGVFYSIPLPTRKTMRRVAFPATRRATQTTMLLTIHHEHAKSSAAERMGDFVTTRVHQAQVNSTRLVRSGSCQRQAECQVQCEPPLAWCSARKVKHGLLLCFWPGTPFQRSVLA
jgi:hypothetical protein